MNKKNRRRLTQVLSFAIIGFLVMVLVVTAIAPY
jgi:multisubunit Na+/H+ antiporter MnhB subunit